MTTNLITKEHKKILKNADSIGFRYISDNESRIECNKEIKIDGYKTNVCEHIVATTDIEMFEGGYSDRHSYEIEKAFCSLSYAKDSLQWQTIVKNIKPNDEIILQWMVGNNCNVLDENNLSNDELHLIIKRNDKKELSFVIDKSVTHKHSLARMVKVRKKYL